MKEEKIEFIELKKQKIPVKIRNYQNSNSIKIYFKGENLQINKSSRISSQRMLQFIKQNENKIMKQYQKSLETPYQIKKWKTGEIFFYKGITYQIIIKETNKRTVTIFKDEKEKTIYIEIPITIDMKEIKTKIDQAMKKFLKQETQEYLTFKLPKWSQITKIEYQSFQVRDATSKYGSCLPSKKILHFSSRLIMLPEDKIDAIIVHELCHITYPNHSQNFYNLVKKYILNYDEVNKWLKQNSRMIVF